MTIAMYRFDAVDSTLTISKAFEKKAAIPGSAEQKVISELMAQYGDALVIERYKTHKTKKGLTFAQMENHIKHSTNKDKMLEQFGKVKELSKSQKNPYKYVKDWFTKHYANYADQPEFDENNLAKVKAAAPAAEKHTENDGSTAKNTVSKMAEGTEKTHDISSSNTIQNTYAQDEEDAA